MCDGHNGFNHHLRQYRCYQCCLPPFGPPLHPTSSSNTLGGEENESDGEIPPFGMSGRQTSITSRYARILSNQSAEPAEKEEKRSGLRKVSRAVPAGWDPGAFLPLRLPVAPTTFGAERLVEVACLKYGAARSRICTAKQSPRTQQFPHAPLPQNRANDGPLPAVDAAASPFSASVSTLLFVLPQLSRTDPGLCAETLARLRSTLQAHPFGALNHQGGSDTVEINQLAAVLADLKRDPGSSEAVRREATTSLLALAVAVGRLDAVLDVVVNLLLDSYREEHKEIPTKGSCQGGDESQTVLIPRNLHSLVLAIQGTVTEETFNGVGCAGWLKPKSKSLRNLQLLGAFQLPPTLSESEDASPQPSPTINADIGHITESCGSCIASDGRHLYLLTRHQGLVKFGSGLEETHFGQLLAQNQLLKYSPGSMLLVAGKSLYLRRRRSPRLWVLDTETLREIGEIILPAAITQDGIILANSSGTNTSLYHTTISDATGCLELHELDSNTFTPVQHDRKWPKWKSCPLVEWSVQLHGAVGGETSADDGSKAEVMQRGLLDNIPSGVLAQMMDLQLGVGPVAFLLTKRGKVHYAGAPTCLEAYGLLTSCCKRERDSHARTWFELPLAERVAEIELLPVTCFLLMRSFAGNLWICGRSLPPLQHTSPTPASNLSRRNTADASTLPTGVRRIRLPAASEEETVGSGEINNPQQSRQKCIAIAANRVADCFAIETERGDCFLFGRHPLMQLPNWRAGMPPEPMSRLALGRSHLTACFAHEGVHTAGLNQHQQCGRADIQLQKPSATLSKSKNYCGAAVMCPWLTPPGPVVFPTASSSDECSAAVGEGSKNNAHGHDSGSPIKVQSISTGDLHTIVLCENNAVYTFGSNSVGQLGTGGCEKRSQPYRLRFPSTAANRPPLQVVQAVAGANHCVLRTRCGQVLTFGAWQRGQLARHQQLGEELATSTGHHAIDIDASAAWFAEPTPVPGYGPTSPRQATWVGARSDYTLVQSQRRLLSDEELGGTGGKCQISLSHTAGEAFLVIPRDRNPAAGENGRHICDALWLDLQKGTLQRETLLPGLDYGLDPRNRSLLWAHNPRLDKIEAYRFGPAAKLGAKAVAAVSLPLELMLPDTVRRDREGGVNEEGEGIADSIHQYSETHIALLLLHLCYHILNTSSSASKAIETASDLESSSAESNGSGEPRAEGSNHEGGGFLVAQRFASLGSSWSYATRSVEAIQFTVIGVELLFCGVGLYGGHGNYSATLRLYRLIGASPPGETLAEKEANHSHASENEEEQSVELIGETEKVDYSCPPHETAFIQMSESYLLHPDQWYIVVAMIEGPNSSDCGAGGRERIIVNIADSPPTHPTRNRVPNGNDPRGKTAEEGSRVGIGVEFRFANSILSNNGTCVEIGQIPEIYCKFPTPSAQPWTTRGPKVVGDPLTTYLPGQSLLNSLLMHEICTAKTLIHLTTIVNWALDSLENAPKQNALPLAAMPEWEWKLERTALVLATALKIGSTLIRRLVATSVIEGGTKEGLSWNNASRTRKNAKPIENLKCVSIAYIRILARLLRYGDDCERGVAPSTAASLATTHTKAVHQLLMHEAVKALLAVFSAFRSPNPINIFLFPEGLNPGGSSISRVAMALLEAKFSSDPHHNTASSQAKSTKQERQQQPKKLLHSWLVVALLKALLQNGLLVGGEKREGSRGLAQLFLRLHDSDKALHTELTQPEKECLACFMPELAYNDDKTVPILFAFNHREYPSSGTTTQAKLISALMQLAFHPRQRLEPVTSPYHCHRQSYATGLDECLSLSAQRFFKHLCEGLIALCREKEAGRNRRMLFEKESILETPNRFFTTSPTPGWSVGGFHTRKIESSGHADWTCCDAVVDDVTDAQLAVDTEGWDAIGFKFTLQILRQGNSAKGPKQRCRLRGINEKAQSNVLKLYGITVYPPTDSRPYYFEMELLLSPPWKKRGAIEQGGDESWTRLCTARGRLKTALKTSPSHYHNHPRAKEEVEEGGKDAAMTPCRVMFSRPQPVSADQPYAVRVRLRRIAEGEQAADAQQEPQTTLFGECGHDYFTRNLLANPLPLAIGDPSSGGGDGSDSSLPTYAIKFFTTPELSPNGTTLERGQIPQLLFSLDSGGPEKVAGGDKKETSQESSNKPEEIFISLIRALARELCQQIAGITASGKTNVEWDCTFACDLLILTNYFLEEVPRCSYPLLLAVEELMPALSHAVTNYGGDNDYSSRVGSNEEKVPDYDPLQGEEDQLPPPPSSTGQMQLEGKGVPLFQMADAFLRQRKFNPKPCLLKGELIWPRASERSRVNRRSSEFLALRDDIGNLPPALFQHSPSSSTAPKLWAYAWDGNRYYPLSASTPCESSTPHMTADWALIPGSRLLLLRENTADNVISDGKEDLASPLRPQEYASRPLSVSVARIVDGRSESKAGTSSFAPAGAEGEKHQLATLERHVAWLCANACRLLVLHLRHQLERGGRSSGNEDVLVAFMEVLLKHRHLLEGGWDWVSNPPQLDMVLAEERWPAIRESEDRLLLQQFIEAGGDTLPGRMAKLVVREPFVDLDNSQLMVLQYSTTEEAWHRLDSVEVTPAQLDHTRTEHLEPIGELRLGQPARLVLGLRDQYDNEITEANPQMRVEVEVKILEGSGVESGRRSRDERLEWLPALRELQLAHPYRPVATNRSQRYVALTANPVMGRWSLEELRLAFTPLEDLAGAKRQPEGEDKEANDPTISKVRLFHRSSEGGVYFTSNWTPPTVEDGSNSQAYQLRATIDGFPLANPLILKVAASSSIEQLLHPRRQWHVDDDEFPIGEAHFPLQSFYGSLRVRNWPSIHTGMEVGRLQRNSIVEFSRVVQNADGTWLKLCTDEPGKGDSRSQRWCLQYNNYLQLEFLHIVEGDLLPIDSRASQVRRIPRSHHPQSLAESDVRLSHHHLPYHHLLPGVPVPALRPLLVDACRRVMAATLWLQSPSQAQGGMRLGIKETLAPRRGEEARALMEAQLLWRECLHSTLSSRFQIGNRHAADNQTAYEYAEDHADEEMRICTGIRECAQLLLELRRQCDEPAKPKLSINLFPELPRVPSCTNPRPQHAKESKYKKEHRMVSGPYGEEYVAEYDEEGFGHLLGRQRSRMPQYAPPQVHRSDPGTSSTQQRELVENIRKEKMFASTGMTRLTRSPGTGGLTRKLTSPSYIGHANPVLGFLEDAIAIMSSNESEQGIRMGMLLRHILHTSNALALALSRSLQTWNWLVRTASNQRAVTDILWQCVAALSHLSFTKPHGISVLENGDIPASATLLLLKESITHPRVLCAAAASEELAAEVVQHFHSLLATVSVILLKFSRASGPKPAGNSYSFSVGGGLDTSGAERDEQARYEMVDCRLRQLCYRIWSFPLTTYDAPIMPILCEIVASTFRTAFSGSIMAGGEGSEQAAGLDAYPLENIAGELELHCSANRNLVRYLVDNSLDTFWETTELSGSGVDNDADVSIAGWLEFFIEPQWQWWHTPRLGSKKASHPLVLGLYVDNAKGDALRISGLRISAASNVDENDEGRISKAQQTTDRERSSPTAADPRFEWETTVEKNFTGWILVPIALGSLANRQVGRHQEKEAFNSPRVVHSYRVRVEIHAEPSAATSSAGATQPPSSSSPPIGGCRVRQLVVLIPGQSGKSLVEGEEIDEESTRGDGGLAFLKSIFQQAFGGGGPTQGLGSGEPPGGRMEDRHWAGLRSMLLGQLGAAVEEVVHQARSNRAETIDSRLPKQLQKRKMGYGNITALIDLILPTRDEQHSDGRPGMHATNMIPFAATLSELFLFSSQKVQQRIASAICELASRSLRTTGCAAPQQCNEEAMHMAHQALGMQHEYLSNGPSPSQLSAAAIRLVANVSFALAKSLTVQIRTMESKGGEGKRRRTTFTLEKHASDIPAGWNSKNELKKVSLLQLLDLVSKMSQGKNDWAKHLCQAITESVLSLCQQVDSAGSATWLGSNNDFTARNVPIPLRSYQFWVKLAALTLLTQGHHQWLDEYWRNDGNSVSPPSSLPPAACTQGEHISRVQPANSQRPMCDNHEDASTRARFYCAHCKMNLCWECHQVLHIGKHARDHEWRALNGANAKLSPSEESVSRARLHLELPRITVHAGCTRLTLARKGQHMAPISISLNTSRLIAVITVGDDADEYNGSCQRESLAKNIAATKRLRCRFCCRRLSQAANLCSLSPPVCDAAECSQLAEMACSTRLSCGHWCCGIAGEADGDDEGSHHPPCLRCRSRETNSLDEGSRSNQQEEEGNSEGHGQQDGDDLCAICLVDTLAAAPCVQLIHCGHLFHYRCIRSVLERRWAGARISFRFVHCPLCGQQISHQHPALEDLLAPLRELRADVERKAMMRLEYDGLLNVPTLTTPSSTFYADPVGYAMERYMYCQCARCHRAYFGGEARCQDERAIIGLTHSARRIATEDGGDVEDDGCSSSNDDTPMSQSQAFNAEELVCGQCSATEMGALKEGTGVCGRHGSEFLEYKCRFCCSVAVYFCFGTTHFCAPCHADFRRLLTISKHRLPQCPVAPGCLDLHAHKPASPVLSPAEESAESGYSPTSSTPNRVQNAAKCPLRIASHPPTGEEFSLGCGICRNLSTF